MALSRTYTPDKRFAAWSWTAVIWAAAILTVAVGAKAFSAESCADIFRESAVWPPPVWKSYLQKIESPTHKTQPMGLVPREYIPAPKEDSRLYTYGPRFVGNPAKSPTAILPQFIEADIQAEIASVSQTYHYVSSFSQSGGPYTIRGDRGQMFVVYDLPRKNEFTSAAKYSEALHKYLSRIDKIVEEEQTYREYDSFFSNASLRRKLADREAIANGAPVGRTRYKTPGSRTTAYPVELFPGTAKGRIAYREEIDRGDMTVIFVGTKIASHVKASEELMKRGADAHKKWVVDLVSEIYPDYVERRHWSEDFIKADFTEVLETLNSTDYIMVRKKDENGKPGELLAAMGFNRASYGKAQMFDPLSGRWMEIAGKFGSTIYSDYPTGQSEIPADTRLIHESTVPLLKMEAYLGKDFRLPRPSVIQGVTFSPSSSRFANGDFVGKQPVYMRAGEIFEPVKFFISKNSDHRSRALSEILSLTAQVFFQLDRSAELSLKGQALYTFNPKTEGSRLYAKRGMTVLANISSTAKDGVDWHVFASKIESFMNKYHEPTAAEKAADNVIAVDTIDAIRRLIDRVLDDEGP